MPQNGYVTPIATVTIPSDEEEESPKKRSKIERPKEDKSLLSAHISLTQERLLPITETARPPSLDDQAANTSVIFPETWPEATLRQGQTESSQRSRIELEVHYKRLFNVDLPAIGRREKWPVWLNHCLLRVALDNYCGKCWYDVWNQRKGALKSMTSDDIHGVIMIGERMRKDGRQLVQALNANSLRWRGKKGPPVAKKE